VFYQSVFLCSSVSQISMLGAERLDGKRNPTCHIPGGHCPVTVCGGGGAGSEVLSPGR
jgi:hypothetical protein